MRLSLGDAGMFLQGLTEDLIWLLLFMVPLSTLSSFHPAAHTHVVAGVHITPSA